MNPKHPSQILPELPPGSDVLILRLRSMGDMVMLTPALAALHAWRPDLKLRVVAQPPFAPVLEGNPAVTEIIPFRTVLACAQDLRGRKFPVLFNHHGGPTSAVLSAGARVPVRVCWQHCQFGFVYNVRVPGPGHFYGSRPVHTVEHRMTQFYYTGLPRGPIPPAQVFPQPDAVASVHEKLTARGIEPGQPYAVMHPGASHPSKQWPLEGFAQIARWMSSEHGLRTVIRLGPADAALAAGIPRTFGPETVVIDPQAMDLREAIALIAGASFFLGNDSGPAHLATAAGRPLVVIFGSTDPVTWGPWQTPHRVVQASGPCEKCKAGRCYASDGGRCILSVRLDAVREACAQMLQSRK